MNARISFARPGSALIAGTKFVRRYMVSDASAHARREPEDVLDGRNTASDVWVDTAYRSQEIEKKLAERALKRRIHGREDLRLRRAALHLSGKDGGGGRVNRRMTLHRRVSGLDKSSPDCAGGGFKWLQ